MQRLMLAPASKFESIDTWHSTGLAGSGSNDYATKDLFVPEGHMLASDPTPTRSAPLYCYFGMFLASWHGIALGLARRPLTRRLLSQKKRSTYSPRRPHCCAIVPTPVSRSRRPRWSWARPVHSPTEQSTASGMMRSCTGGCWRRTDGRWRCRSRTPSEALAASHSRCTTSSGRQPSTPPRRPWIACFGTRSR